jgi:hypothetical protein
MDQDWARSQDKPMPSDEELKGVQKRAHKLIADSFMSDLPLLYPPAQVRNIRCFTAAVT